MSRTIDITNATFLRLERLAVGFDTPEAVINRLLDKVEGHTVTKPKLTFFPVDEEEFKNELIKFKEAEVVIFKKDGSREITHWKANRLNESSSLRGNLWSGLLRGWKSKGIMKADLFILPSASAHTDDETERTKILALEFQLTYEEMEHLTYDIDTNESSDGQIYNYIIQFNEENDPKILSKIKDLHENNWINIGTEILN